jgi:hypothetical protein
VHGASSVCSVVASLASRDIGTSPRSLCLQEEIRHYRNVVVLCGDDDLVQVLSHRLVDVSRLSFVEEVWCRIDGETSR